MPIGISLKNRRVGVGETAVVIPSGNTVDRPVNPIFGSIRFNVDIGQVEFWNGTSWSTLVPAGTVDIIVDRFTADGVTQTFGPLAQTVAATEDVLVFVGNVWQAPDDNYDIATNDTLQLPFAPADGLQIHVIHNFSSNFSG